MSRLLGLFVFAGLLLNASCQRIDDVALVSGELQLTAGQRLSLVDAENQELTFVRDRTPMRVSISGEEGNSEFTLKIDAENSAYTFRVPRAALKDRSNFGFDLRTERGNVHARGTRSTQLVSERFVEATDSCTYHGYCTGCGMGMNGKTNCKAKFQSCSGTRRVLRRMTETETRFELTFADETAPEKTLAIFRGNPIVISSTENARDLSSCH